MANRIWRDMQTPKRSRKLVSGSFGPAGAGDPSTNIKGVDIQTVIRFGAGDFGIYLFHSYVDVESVTLSLQLAAATDRFIRVTAIDTVTGVSGFPVSFVRCLVTDGANAPQDVAADANNRIHITAMVRNN